MIGLDTRASLPPRAPRVNIAMTACACRANHINGRNDGGPTLRGDHVVKYRPRGPNGAKIGYMEVIVSPRRSLF